MDDKEVYKPANPWIYTREELEQAIEGLKLVHDETDGGELDQHFSPCLLIAIDCISDFLNVDESLRRFMYGASLADK